MTRSAANIAAALSLLAGLIMHPKPGLATDAARPVKVVTTIFPLRDWIQTVGGRRVEVVQLLPPGTEAHGYAPRPADIAAVRKADLFVFLSPAMEPWAVDLLAGSIRPGLRIFEAAANIPPPIAADGLENNGDTHDDHNAAEGEHDGHAHHDGPDPHVWLDPVRAVQIVSDAAKVLGEVDPPHQAEYAQRAQEYVSRLLQLDAGIRDALSDCERRTVIFVGHSAFRYFAERYDIRFITPYPGFSPNAAPGPRAMAELARQVRETGSTVVFHEELVVPRIAQAIARETGARLEVLHAVHNVSPQELQDGATYLSIMEDNARKLRDALGCGK